MMFKFGKIRGVEEWQKFIKSLPRGVVKVALPALAEWLIGNEQRGLAHYSLYKYVTRKQAYGKTFQSDRQRRWFFAALDEGKILPGYPRRTGRTQRGYVQRPTNGGYGVMIENKEEGAYYTRDDKGQARLNALAGWRKTMDVVSTNIVGAIRHAQAAVNAWLKKQ